MTECIRKQGRLIVLAVLSFAVYVMANGQISIPAFTWIYPALLLHMADICRSRKVCFIIFGVYAVGFVTRYVSVIGMGFGVCAAAAVFIAALNSFPYLYWIKSNRDFKATITFAAAMVAVEFGIYMAYPILGGLSDAYTQYKNPLLLQAVTVTGIYGITFIIYWTAAVVVWLWGRRGGLRQIKKYVLIYCAVMGLVFVYGVIMHEAVGAEESSVRIAGVTAPVSQLLNEDEDVYAVFYTDTFTDENLLNAKRKLSRVTDELFAKTVKEAKADAKIVFWSELNGAVLKEDEAGLLQRASDIARQQGIYLVVSLLVKTPYEALKENKTAAFNPQGEYISQYYKFGRSIGELCLKGDGKLKSFDTEYGRIAPFICSDMAFSAQIRQAGKDKVDILIVPASDWKEMTAIAIRTAVVRGVENGCSVVRHTNQGISLAADARGNILALADYFQSDTRAIAAQVLTGGRFTVYSRIGDIFVYLCGLYLIGVFGFGIMNKRRIGLFGVSALLAVSVSGCGRSAESTAGGENTLPDYQYLNVFSDFQFEFAIDYNEISEKFSGNYIEKEYLEEFGEIGLCDDYAPTLFIYPFNLEEFHPGSEDLREDGTLYAKYRGYMRSYEDIVCYQDNRVTIMHDEQEGTYDILEYIDKNTISLNGTEYIRIWYRLCTHNGIR